MQESVFGVAQIPGGLAHPAIVGICRASGEVHPSRRQFHNKEQVTGNEPTLGPNFDRGEIYGGQHIPVGFEKALPRRLAASDPAPVRQRGR